MPPPRVWAGSPLFRFLCSRSSTSSPSRIDPRSISCRPAFFFCLGASSLPVLLPMSRILILPASDSGSPVFSSVLLVTKRRSAWRTRLDIAEYLYCETLLGSAMMAGTARSRRSCALLAFEGGMKMPSEYMTQRYSLLIHTLLAASRFISHSVASFNNDKLSRQL